MGPASRLPSRVCLEAFRLQARSPGDLVATCTLVLSLDAKGEIDYDAAEAITPFGPSTWGQPHARGPGVGHESVGTGAEDRERSDRRIRSKERGPPMATAFSRSLRFLAADGSRRSAWGGILAVVLLGGWMAWLFLARVSLYQVTQTARLEVGRAIHPVEAPVAGRIVETANRQVGEVVSEGERLASVAPVGELKLVADFLPAALGRIRPGQSARCRAAPGRARALARIPGRPGREPITATRSGARRRLPLPGARGGANLGHGGPGASERPFPEAAGDPDPSRRAFGVNDIETGAARTG